MADLSRRTLFGLVTALGLTLPTLAKPAPARRRVFARKGEVAICENGHPYARLKRDVFYGDMQSDQDWENLSTARFGDTKCHCGGWLRPIDGLGRYWFKGDR